MTKLVGFIGAPGTGKTTIACAMKDFLLARQVSSDVCTEYAREFCYKYGVSTNLYAQYRINLNQMEREDLLMQGSCEYLFSDSPIWMGYVYSLVNYPSNASKEERSILPDIYERFVINQIDRYHRVFYLTNAAPHDDGCRDMDKNSHIATVMDSFVASHEHILPIERVAIPIEDKEKRKEVVWKNLTDVV